MQSLVVISAGSAGSLVRFHVISYSIHDQANQAISTDRTVATVCVWRVHSTGLVFGVLSSTNVLQTFPSLQLLMFERLGTRESRSIIGNRKSHRAASTPRT